MKKIFGVLLLLVLVSCGTKKQTSVYQYSTPIQMSEKVEIISLGQTIPETAKFLGSVKISDTGFSTKCSYAEVIKDVEQQARSMGGNLIVIKEHKEPSVLGSTCHRIKADVYLKNK